MKLLPGAVASFQHQIAQAERAAIPAYSTATPARYPLAPDQIAASHYAQRLAFDDQIRNSASYAVTSTIGIDDGYVAQLRAGVAGRLGDQGLADLMGALIKRFRAAGNLDAAPGSDEWRAISCALCSAELEALTRVVERDEGNYSGQGLASVATKRRYADWSAQSWGKSSDAASGMPKTAGVVTEATISPGGIAVLGIRPRIGNQMRALLSMAAVHFTAMQGAL